MNKVELAIQILSYFADEKNYKKDKFGSSWIEEEGQAYAHNTIKILMNNPSPDSKEYKQFLKTIKTKKCPLNIFF